MKYIYLGSMNEYSCLQRSEVSLLDPLKLESETVMSHHTLVV